MPLLRGLVNTMCRHACFTCDIFETMMDIDATHTHTSNKKQPLNYADCAQLTVMKSWKAQLV